jgi:hypothetical protein
MTLGLLDLWIVTDYLVKQLDTAKTVSHLWDEDQDPPATPGHHDSDYTIVFSGLSPDEVRGKSDCQVSLYLFHVAPDKFYRNTFPQGGRPREIPEQPLALTLYYLLTAHSKDQPRQEQQAMSIALKCFHDRPTMTTTVPIDHRKQQVVLTMEPQSVDEVGRLWQAFSTPIRLSVVYRASVVFLEPELPVKAPQIVTKWPMLVPARDVPPPPRLESGARPFEDPPASQVIAPSSWAEPIVVAANGLATITGLGFNAPLISVRVSGLEFQAMATGPTAGHFRVISDTELRLQFPPGTGAGRYVVRIQLDPQQPTAEGWLRVLTDVPP